jgi:hypothetical protein
MHGSMISSFQISQNENSLSKPNQAPSLLNSDDPAKNYKNLSQNTCDLSQQDTKPTSSTVIISSSHEKSNEKLSKKQESWADLTNPELKEESEPV